MSDTFQRQGAYDSVPGSEAAAMWRPDLAVVWPWVHDVLAMVHATHVDTDLVEGMCSAALDIHAPALVVQAQGAGVALDQLLVARIAEAYSDRYGPPDGWYKVAGLRAVVRLLTQGCGATA